MSYLVTSDTGNDDSFLHTKFLLYWHRLTIVNLYKQMYIALTLCEGLAILPARVKF